MFKQVTFKTKGMLRDLSKSSFTKDYAYENKNMRLTCTDEGILGSMVNEKGPKVFYLKDGDKSTKGNLIIQGTPLGQAIIDNTYILFTHAIVNKELKKIPVDYIYKIVKEDDEYTGYILYKGDLNFDDAYPIETLTYYENNSVRKVYWTDNRNQPRSINIDTDYWFEHPVSGLRTYYSSSVFDFIPTLSLKESVTIEKINASDGQFPAGTVQYYLTYFDLYGHESNIFYTSPLYYTSFTDRAGKADEKIGNVFRITVSNIEYKFDYVRVYCSIRTSINDALLVRKVADIKIPKEEVIESVYGSTGTEPGALSIIDDGIIGEDVSDYSLLFKGGNPITVKTLNQKDNTLFIGNIKEKIPRIDSTLRQEIQEVFTDAFEFKEENVTIKEVKEFSNGSTSKSRKAHPSYIIPQFDRFSLLQPSVRSYYPWNSSLKYNRSQITTFKTGETYRIGVQFQHNTGVWSDVVFIEDIQNNNVISSDFLQDVAKRTAFKKFNITVKYNIVNNVKKYLWPTEEQQDLLNNVLSKLQDLGYIKIRPVVVYPELADRDVICQGLLCPTVFNVSDRADNAPFAQSSWFIRPNVPFNIESSSSTSTQALSEETQEVITPEDSGGIITPGGDSGGGTTTGIKKAIEQVSYNGACYAEFRHFHPLPGAGNRNAEIQCNIGSPYPPLYNDTITGATIPEKAETFVSNFKDTFYVDQSIVTFHSPDLEFDDNLKNMDLSQLKFRIVGIVPITSHTSDIDISAGGTLAILNKDIVGKGFNKKIYNNFLQYNGLTCQAYRGLISDTLWVDGVAKSKKNSTSSSKEGTDYISVTAFQKAFAVYPWHRETSLNNDTNYVDYTASAVLKKKRLSNFYCSYGTLYLYRDNFKNIGTSDIQLFDSEEVSMIRLKANAESNGKDIVYYGNIDRVITPSLDNITDNRNVADRSDGYDIFTTADEYYSTSSGTLTQRDYITLTKAWEDIIKTNIIKKVNDPIHIKYKSTVHAVLSLAEYDGSTITQNLPVLPCIRWYKNTAKKINPIDINITTEKNTYFWLNDNPALATGEEQKELNKAFKVKQDDITCAWNGYTNGSPQTQFGFLWLGELYRDSVVNKFGGSSEEATALNTWIPCGDTCKLTDTDALCNIKWTDGDTYYQRYDHIKTYPFTTEDKNSVSEVVSFMCETRINLDGRCDKNRRNYNNLIITPEKFNMINDVYSQTNNYFTYKSDNSNKKTITEYFNIVSWGNTKTPGEDVDSWTSVNLAASLDFDGNLGNINSIKRFNNDIIVFQDKGISTISYNENVQVSATNGVPIEILNSGKVTGKRYISDTIGSVNKWSICTTPDGLFFIDDNSKNIYMYNGRINNISDAKGFNSWVRQNSNLKEWNPNEFENFIAYYDSINNEILFIGADDCLVYSLKVNEFTSFYDYNDSPYFFNLYDKGFFIHKDDSQATNSYSLFEEHAGSYNRFFNDDLHPSWTEVIVNEEPLKDKIFNNVEYNSDTWIDGKLSNVTFNKVSVYNEYQQGEAQIEHVLYKPSLLKRKFRTWRIQIPRTKDYEKGKIHNRMRNPWMGLKLTYNGMESAKLLLNDITVSYSCN